MNNNNNNHHDLITDYLFSLLLINNKYKYLLL